MNHGSFMRCKLKATLTFSVDMMNLLVQAVESKSGGCELVLRSIWMGHCRQGVLQWKQEKSYCSSWKGGRGNTSSTAAVLVLLLRVPLVYWNAFLKKMWEAGIPVLMFSYLIKLFRAWCWQSWKHKFLKIAVFWLQLMATEKQLK